MRGRRAGRERNDHPFLGRLRGARRVAGVFMLLRGFIFLVGGMAVAGTGLLLLSLAGGMDLFLFRGVWVLSMAVILFFLFRRWGTVSVGDVAEKLRATPRDQFLTAAELASENLSDEFRTRAIAQAEAAFPADWVKRVAAGRWRPLLLFSGVSLLLLGVVIWKTPARVCRQALWPFGPEETGIRSVSPGDAFFPRGDDVTVTVRVSTGNIIEPVLEVRSAGAPWETRRMGFLSSGGYAVVLRSLNEKVEYRILYQNRRSVRYRLTPFDPVKLLHLRARVEPPDYAGRKPELYEDVLSLRVLAGSRVRWALALDPSDSLLRVDGEALSEIPEKTGADWVWTETVHANMERHLWARRSNGSGESLLADVAMEAVADTAPQVSLLGPSEDLQADAKDRIPVAAELTDDVGISAAGFSFRVNGGTWTRQEWKRFSAAVVQEVLEKDFDLAGIRLKAGDQVEFYVYAQDARRPAGEGHSEVRRIDVVDASAAHEKVLQDMGAFQKALADRLAEQRELRETVAVSTPNWGGLLTGQRQVARRLSVDDEQLKALLDQMAQDPMTPQEMILTYQGIAEHLEEMRTFSMPEADRSLTDQDQPGSERAMDQAVAELEMMNQLSAQAARAQNSRQLLRDQGELANMAENLERSLAGKPTLTAEEARQMQETARAMQEAMDRIRERVEKMRKEMSEEDSKNAKVEVLRFDRVSRAFDRLSQALEDNDGAGALAAAKEALEQLKEIERQLSRADQSASGEGSGGEGSAEEEAMTEEQAQLKKLIQRQEVLLDKTLDVQEKRVARRLAEQSKILDQVQRLVGRWADQNVMVNSSTGIVDAGDLTEEERGLILGWVEEQGKLAADTLSLSTAVAETARQTAFLSPKISRRVSSASVEMEGASQALRTFMVLPAQGKQEKALELLRDAHEKLSNALKNMQSLSQSGGTGGKPWRRPGGKSGARGTTGDVPLPRADDFRPPMEFRQEILDSMKESYPKDQEAPVQDYYRHWTK